MVQMNRFARQKMRHRCREQMYGHQGGKAAVGGGAVMNWEIGIDIYTLMCIKLMTNKNLLYKKINKIQFKKNDIETFSYFLGKSKTCACLLFFLFRGLRFVENRGWGDLIFKDRMRGITNAIW